MCCMLMQQATQNRPGLISTLSACGSCMPRRRSKGCSPAVCMSVSCQEEGHLSRMGSTGRNLRRSGPASMTGRTDPSLPAALQAPLSHHSFGALVMRSTL